MILIRRAQGLRHHPGEIGLPGGGVNPGEGMVDAALREAHEEVGLPPEAVEVVGWLDLVVGRTSGFVALPIVGLLAERPLLRPDPGEVAAVFDVSLDDLMAEGVHRQEEWDVGGDSRSVHFFDMPDVTVWGMTGRVLHQFLQAVTGRTGPPTGAPPGGQGETRPPAPP